MAPYNTILRSLLAVCTVPLLVSALPTSQSSKHAARQAQSSLDLSDPLSGPIPGQSSYYTSEYQGIEAPWPGNTTGAVLNTTSGAAGEDDLLFQNLLSAEWVIFSFYQQAVEMFNTTSFTTLSPTSDLKAARLNTTYNRIVSIRNGEAGHLRIFQDQISSTSIKPGPCQYVFPFNSSTPETFLALQLLIESSSMQFLTGLALGAQLPTSKSALVAIAETETRHNTWSLISNYNVDPFAGPADTVFPYANQVLDTTNGFIIPGSCPSENPLYPDPRQSLPQFTALRNGTTGLAPGDTVAYAFSPAASASPNDTSPIFTEGQSYYAVFFHGVFNISVPFDTTTNSSTIPAEFDPLGVIVAVIASEEGAPTMDSVVAGPATILQQPVGLAAALVEG